MIVATFAFDNVLIVIYAKKLADCYEDMSIILIATELNASSSDELWIQESEAYNLILTTLVHQSRRQVHRANKAVSTQQEPYCNAEICSQLRLS